MGNLPRGMMDVILNCTTVVYLPSFPVSPLRWSSVEKIYLISIPSFNYLPPGDDDCSAKNFPDFKVRS